MRSMHKTKFAAAAAVIAVIVISVICVAYISYDRSYQRADVDLYFINEDATGIVATSQKIKYRNESELIQNTLESLRRGPSSEFYCKVSCAHKLD